MANSVATTQMRDTKDHSNTRTLAAFTAFVTTFRAATDAEARIDDPATDPMSAQFIADFRRAEHRREHLIARSFDVLEPVPETPGDLRLQALASALTRVFTIKNAEAQQTHLKDMREKTLNFMNAHPDPDMQIVALQNAFLHTLEEMARLHEFGGEGHVSRPVEVLEPISA